MLTGLVNRCKMSWCFKKWVLSSFNKQLVCFTAHLLSSIACKCSVAQFALSVSHFDQKVAFVWTNKDFDAGVTLPGQFLSWKCPWCERKNRDVPLQSEGHLERPPGGSNQCLCPLSCSPWCRPFSCGHRSLRFMSTLWQPNTNVL